MAPSDRLRRHIQTKNSNRFHYQIRAYERKREKSVRIRRSGTLY